MTATKKLAQVFFCLRGAKKINKGNILDAVTANEIVSRNNLLYPRYEHWAREVVIHENGVVEYL